MKDITASFKLGIVGLGFAVIAILVATPLVQVRAATSVEPISTSFTKGFPTPVVSKFGDGTDRQVWSLAARGGQLYVAGKFAQVTLPDGSTTNRGSLYSFDAEGDSFGRISSFNPKVMNGSGLGEVDKVITSYDGQSLIIGGTFTSITDSAGHKVSVSNLARLSLPDSQGDFTVQPFGSTNGRVSDIEKAKNLYVLAGYFTKVDDQAQGSIASVTQTGAFSSYVRTKVTGTVGPRAGATHAWRLAVGQSDTAMVAIVNATHVDGYARQHLVKFDLNSSHAVVSNWRPVQESSTASCAHKYAIIRDVFYVKGGFMTVATGGNCASSFNDKAMYWSNSAHGAGVRPVWANRTCADTEWAGVAYRGVAYISGHMKCTERIPGGDRDYVDRMGIIALRVSDGHALSWRSDQPRCVGGKVDFIAYGKMWSGLDCAPGLVARSTTP